MFRLTASAFSPPRAVTWMLRSVTRVTGYPGMPSTEPVPEAPVAVTLAIVTSRSAPGVETSCPRPRRARRTKNGARMFFMRMFDTLTCSSVPPSTACSEIPELSSPFTR